LLFCAILWVMVFLQTYMHFPKMEKQKRLFMSVINATALSLSLLVLVVVSLWLLMNVIFGKSS